MTAILTAALLLMFAIPLGLTCLKVAFARPEVYRPRADGYANEWAARKGRR